MVRALFSGILLFAICSPALAQEVAVFGATLPQLSQLAITLLGMAFAARLACDAFGRPPVPVADVPTFPKYMTSRKQYRIGQWLFVAFACGFFLLLVYEHRQVLKAASLLGNVIPQDILQAAEDRSASYLVIVIAMAALYLYLLKQEFQWNVLLMTRDLIFRWISIPQLAVQIVAQMRFTLRVPNDAITAVVASSIGVVEQDFCKDSNTPDRLWAESCYMKWWLTQGNAAGQDATFFTEESFGFDKLLEEQRRLSRDVTSWKSGAAADLVLPELFEKIRGLHNRFARLVACYLIYRNGSRQRLSAEAAKFGIEIEKPIPQSSARYWIVYIVALVAAVYVGVYVSAVTYDLFAGDGVILAQDVNRTLAWIMYALSNYGLAIIVILLIRLASERMEIARNQSHLITYCWTFLVAFLVGPIGLTLAVKLFGQGSNATLPLYELYFNMVRWGLGPALVSVYISYYLDRQICEDLPSIDHSPATIGWRFVNCFVFSAITMVLFLPLLSALVAQPGSNWNTDKLRLVAFGTTFFVTFALALTAQFALIARSSAPRAALSPRTAG